MDRGDAGGMKGGRPPLAPVERPWFALFGAAARALRVRADSARRSKSSRGTATGELRCRFGPVLLAVVLIGPLASDAVAVEARLTPRLIGMSRAEATMRLDRDGTRAEWRPAGPAPVAAQAGRVAFQDPPAGVPENETATVILWVYEPGAAPQPEAARLPDCSGWRGSIVDPATGTCSCPQGQWWSADGSSCTTREETASQLCAKFWPGSVPRWPSSGDFHCQCPPDLFWDAETLRCGPQRPDAAPDCAERWPGTTPVFSPGATAYECRCPGGLRWDDDQRRCLPAVEPQSASEAPQPSTGSSGSAAGEPASRPPAPQGAPAGPPNSECSVLLSEINSRARAGRNAEADALALTAAARGCDPESISEAVRGAREEPPAVTPSAPGMRY